VDTFITNNYAKSRRAEDLLCEYYHILYANYAYIKPVEAGFITMAVSSKLNIPCWVGLASLTG